MDKQLNDGFICAKHEIGYFVKCPTCASLEKPPKQNKKTIKKVKQLLRKTKRKN